MTNPEIDAQGNKYWRNAKGQLHREDGPAIENPNGCVIGRFEIGYLKLDWVNNRKEWFINGKRIK